MNLIALAAVLRARATLAMRERWTREELEAAPKAIGGSGGLQVALDVGEPHGRIRDKLVEALHQPEDPPGTPPRARGGTRGRTMTGPSRRSEGSPAPEPGGYRVAATGGTTGRRGIFLSDSAEWTQVLASYSRAYAWAGLDVGISHPLPVRAERPGPLLGRGRERLGTLQAPRHDRRPRGGHPQPARPRRRQRPRPSQPLASRRLRHRPRPAPQGMGRRSGSGWPVSSHQLALIRAAQTPQPVLTAWYGQLPASRR